ncbi:MAG: zinc ribbon domain-containing protein [Lachnospiraceae bacterium]|nr:zinc ribbon domain-containing protein [Lachnospiraceae bacterium]
MTCKNCGNEISSEEKFCSRCGAQIFSENSSVETENNSKETANYTSEAGSTGKKMPANIIMAIISSILLVVCIPLKLMSGDHGYLSMYNLLASTGSGLFRAYIIYVLLFVIAFLAGTFTGFRKLRILGCIGIWIATAWWLFIVFVMGGGASTAYGSSFTLGLGFYLYILGVVLQTISGFKKEI